jgi:hypothetical protein
MHDLKLFILMSLISLPTVMFGGYSTLIWLYGKLTAEQLKFFRLGHAHAGVLLILSLVYYYYLSLTNFSVPTKLAACGVLATGIIMQSGGFFWHAFLDTGKQRIGIYVTSLGALLLVIAISWLAFGLAISL